MSIRVEVEKLDSALRHLTVGIELFFEQRDPIVVHTVAWASYQVLSDLCSDRGIERQIEDSSILESLGAKKEFLAAFRKPHNFFKHADKDPNGTVGFFPDSNYLVLLLAVENYAKLTNDIPIHGAILRTWFFIKYPERTPPEFRISPSQFEVAPDPSDFPFFLRLLRSKVQGAAGT